MRLRDLNFKVAPDVHRIMKLAAAYKDTSMVRIVLEALDGWLNSPAQHELRASLQGTLGRSAGGLGMKPSRRARSAPNGVK